MGAGGSHPQAMSDPEGEETKGLRRLRWADCEDEGRKEQVVLSLVGLEIEEGEKGTAREETTGEREEKKV